MGGFNQCTAYAAITVTVSTTPTITFLGTPSVCVGSSTTLYASGASTYSWNTGVTTSSIVVNPSETTIYSVLGTNGGVCSSTQTVNILVNQMCQRVWPGDVNSDGVANNLDVLELGLHYNQTGPPRASVSAFWQSLEASNWSDTISNGKNLNHSDCNGNGVINSEDTLAIYNNYGQTHGFRESAEIVSNPMLKIIPDQDMVVKEAWGSSSIYLGDSINVATNVNGIAFTIDYYGPLIQSTNIWLEYNNSFINIANDNLHFRKQDIMNSKILTATTHTLNNNVSGFGKIAILHYQIKSNLSNDYVLNLGITQAYQSDVNGIITPLTSGTGTLMAIGGSVGLLELNGNLISVSPNPTNGTLIIRSKSDLQKIEIVSITGQVLLSETPTGISHTLHLENFSNGIYFVNVYQNDRIVKREKVVLNK